MSTNEIRQRARGWRFFLTRSTVLALCDDLESVQRQYRSCGDDLAEARAHNIMLAQELSDLRAKHEIAKKGTAAMLGFIQQTHRLTPKLPDAIQETLSK